MKETYAEKLVSIILPCYNVENWIDRCLTSIIDQTVGFDILEVICVDDCSTDDTLQKLCEWEKKYPNTFIIVKSETNGRQGKARNIGLQYASANWIAFIDADDWIEKNYLELMMNAVDDECDLICCRYDRDFSKSLSYYTDNSEWQKPLSLEDNIVEYNSSTDIIIDSEFERKKAIINPILKYCVWAKIIRKSFLMENDIYFPENITYEDAVWGSLLHLYFNKAKIVEKKLYHYFVNEDSTVLKMNSFHHFDSITSQTILWKLYEERGFIERYREELEIEHIFSAYLPVIKASIYRYDPPNYNMYLLIRAIMIDRIGSYKDNTYIKNGYLSEVQLLLMDAIDNELTKDDFFYLAENVKRIGI